MDWENILLEKKSKSFKYKVCTDSIAKTAGTPKRSTWSSSAKDRYDRCLKKVTEAEGDIRRGGGKPGQSLSRKELKAMIARLKTHSELQSKKPKQRTFSFK
jgi:endonuclease YncB( thermonuclease family)